MYFCIPLARTPYIYIYIYTHIYDRGEPRGALNLSSTSYPDHGRCGDLHLQRKIPTSEPGIEPGTPWLVVRSSDKQVKTLFSFQNAFYAFMKQWI
jgi:hypothetical protein